jgi:hypothetical protein
MGFEHNRSCGRHLEMVSAVSNSLHETGLCCAGTSGGDVVTDLDSVRSAEDVGSDEGVNDHIVGAWTHVRSRMVVTSVEASGGIESGQDVDIHIDSASVIDGRTQETVLWYIDLVNDLGSAFIRRCLT